MRFDEIDAVSVRRRSAGRLYEEFLRAPSMSAGLYELPAGAADPQQPHAEDELYHVIAGQAVFEYRDTRTPVGPGSVLFVEAGAPHRFVEIASDLRVLVVFAPAETPPAGA